MKRAIWLLGLAAELLIYAYARAETIDVTINPAPKDVACQYQGNSRPITGSRSR